MKFAASDPFSHRIPALSALFGFGLLTFASVAVAQLTGSAHDFSGNIWGGAGSASSATPPTALISRCPTVLSGITK